MWMLLTLSYLMIYLAVGLVLIVPGLTLQFGNEKKRRSKDVVSDLNKLTVIIPFRNEANQLEKLLECFNSSEKLPKHIIFVNDHSEDAGPEFLSRHLSKKPFVILDMPCSKEGKKEAIRFALAEVKTPYFLTMDADIWFSKTYFGELEKLQWKELHVLPVQMVSHSFIGRIAEIDHLLVNALNACTSGWKRPFIASGANLLVKKSSFEKYDRFDLHKHIPSGDDTYLLRDFRKNGAEVVVHTEKELTVSTFLPPSFKAFLTQRIRWAAKTGDIGDSLANLIVLIQAILSGSFVLILWTLLFFQDGNKVLFFWLAKTTLDILFFLPFVFRVNRMLTLVWMPVYEWIYPFYAVTIAFGAYIFRPKWKGRTIRVR